MADSRTLSYTAEQIDAILAAARMHSNRNLLDNWYFGNPVDQRGGYVVSPDTPYYSDTDLTTQAGTVSAYTKATQVNSTYGTITVSGTTYYVAWSAAVRGYTGAGYTIDRWRSDGRLVVLVEADGIRIINTGESGTTFIQNGELQKAASLAGLNVSGAVVYKATGFVTMYSWVENAGNSLDMVLSPTQNWSLASCYAEAVTDETAQQYIAIGFYLNSGAELCLKAAKLELGTQQTLAHQEDGVWVLNEIPDYGEQLARCQRYFYRPDRVVLIRTPNTNSFTINANFNTTMRTAPTVAFGTEMTALVPGVTDSAKVSLQYAHIDENGIGDGDFISFTPADAEIFQVKDGQFSFSADL